MTWDGPPGGAGIMGHIVTFHTFRMITCSAISP